MERFVRCANAFTVALTSLARWQITSSALPNNITDTTFRPKAFNLSNQHVEPELSAHVRVRAGRRVFDVHRVNNFKGGVASGRKSGKPVNGFAVVFSKVGDIQNAFLGCDS
jgi:hypothetical protein